MTDTRKRKCVTWLRGPGVALALLGANAPLHAAPGGLPAAISRGLLPQDRGHAVLLDGNGVAAASGLIPRYVEAPTHAGDGMYRGADGEVFAAPDVSPPPVGRSLTGRPDRYGANISMDKRTGPYHGVYARPGFSFEAATVHLPGGAQFPPSLFVSAAQAADTPYVYMGGQGAHGGAVDAGFQYSPRKNDWSLFLVCEGFGFHGFPGPRFASDQDVTLRFYVPADDVLAVSATGTDVTGATVTQALLLDVHTYPATAPADRVGRPTGFGWRADGAGCILKRLTSIAQAHQAFDTRSYSRGVHWQAVRLGVGAAHARPWREADSIRQMNWPDTQHIRVQRQGPTEETVNIDLGVGGSASAVP